jgi:tRNA (guanine37-N1)-methyltransferase
VLTLKKQYGILVPIRKAEETLQILRSLGLLDHGHELIRAEDNLLLPLTRELSENEISQIRAHAGEAKTEFTVFAEAKNRPRKLEEAVGGQIPTELIQRIPRALDVIGDVSIVELPEELERFSSVIGEGIMRINPHIRLVLEKGSEIGGRLRTRKFKVIAGVGATETVHREFSCHYHLNVSTVYFNQRLSRERMRVAQQVKAGETVVDMFAGVGPYSILIAKLQPHSTVYSADVNPEAMRYLKDNVFTNQVADRVIPMLGEAKQLAERRLRGLANRIIMNLPSEAEDYLPAAAQILKAEGGVIHFYAFASREESLETIRSLFQSAVEHQNRKVESFQFCKAIREVAPGRVQVAIDSLVK